MAADKIGVKRTIAGCSVVAPTGGAGAAALVAEDMGAERCVTQDGDVKNGHNA
jgi:hypothetical protein